MADLSQTAANVGLSGQGVTLQIVQAGEAVTQGQPGYKKASDAKYYQCDADDSAKAAALGIFLAAAAANGYTILATSGPVDLGATLTVGETYVISTNKGAIAPVGDLVTGDYVTHLGVATAADKLELSPSASGVAVP